MAMDEVYFELVTQLLGDDEPWKQFTDFANEVTRGAHKKATEAAAVSNDLASAYKYFEGGKKHLWHISYMHCRRLFGIETANEAFDGRRRAVDELMSILH